MNGKRPSAGWRVKIGFTIFVASIGWPVLIPLLLLLGVSTTTTATLSGVMVVAAEFMLIAGAAIAGKEGFAMIKATVFGFVKSYAPPATVGRVRYRIGLIMFVIPFVFGWAAPYLGSYLPGFEQGELYYAIFFDVLLLISLFVLGGEFWDKLRSLFTHRAYAVIPAQSTRESTSG